MERPKEVSVVRLPDVLLENREYDLRGRNNGVTTSHQYVSKQVSNETLNNVSVVRHQDDSLVRIHDVPLLRPYDVSCKTQMNHLTMLLWYVSTTSRSYVVPTVSTFPSYFVMSSIW